MQKQKNALLLSVFASSIVVSGCTNQASAPENNEPQDNPNTTTTSANDDVQVKTEGDSESQIDTSSRLQLENQADGNAVVTNSDNGGLPPGTTRKDSTENIPSEVSATNEPAPTGSENSDLEQNAVAGGEYKNGVYTETGAYETPGGTANIKVIVTIAGDTITDVEVTPIAEKEASMKNQAKFAAEIDAVVVGKKIDEITELQAVNGSSLTGQGFLDAIEKIKLNAQQI